MQITWHGQYTVKVQTGDLTLVLDPYSPETGLSPFKAKADIVALTNPDDSTMSHTSGIQGDHNVLDTPGEYSVDGLNLHAIRWTTEDGSERSLHRWMIEGIVVLHLGAIDRQLTDTELQELEKTAVDVLLLPVGGGSSLDTKEALKLLTIIDPRIVIPIHYKIDKVKEEIEGVEGFAKEMGIDPSQVEKKLTLKANRLPQEDMETVILAP